MLWGKLIVPHTPIVHLRFMVGVTWLVVLAMCPWQVCLVCPLSAAKPLLLFVHTACHGAFFQRRGFSRSLGIRTVVSDI